MSHLCNNKNSSTLRNVTQKQKSFKKGQSTYRRKSYGAIKMGNTSFKMPSGINLNTAKSKRTHRMTGESSKRAASKYGSILNESSLHRHHESCGEYSYGKGGSSFPKSVKKSKFDEEKEKVYSPGPAKYIPRVNEASTMFSFGKQKKEFSFVKNGSRDVPSPGKYKVKRDFLSKSKSRK